MGDPWKGAGAPARPADFENAANKLGCDPAVIRAIWQVEAAGHGFEADGSLIRRFEPHKMPGSKMTWRDSLKIGSKKRAELFAEAYRATPMDALRATSWGGPQIMGFNATDAGHSDARDMVEAMAASESAQILAMVTLVEAWGIASCLRSHDFLTFAKRWNGSGQPEVYARKIEAAVRSETGVASPEVLRLGDRGSAVKRLQAALGLEEDGAFGPETEAAVRQFQARNGLTQDGLVGKLTWDALQKGRDARPVPQPITADKVADKVTKWGGVATAGSAGAAALQNILPHGAYTILAYGAVGLGLVAVAAYLLRRWRAA